MSFNITLVRSQLKHKPYAKVDGTYSGPTWINNIGLQTIQEDPKEILRILQILSTRIDTCMVMGTAIRPEILGTDRTLKNFKEEPIRMLVFDLDKYEVPNVRNMTYSQLQGVVKDFIKKYLPPEFQDTTFFLRFSSNFMISDKDYLRTHIIFILEEAQYPREIGLWIKHNKIPADASFYFNLTQPIFTAAPIWINVVDPLKLRDPEIPRVGIATGGGLMVRGGWNPEVFHKYREPIHLEDLPTAAQLPGKAGSFCRMVPISKILLNLGYTEESEGRFLAPNSQTGIPGAISFPNGFVFSHHEGDPINQVVEQVFNFKRRSLNAYDLMSGWAKINNHNTDILRDFEFFLEQAVASDTIYQDEVVDQLTARAEWLEEGGYEGTNRKIIDGLVSDMHSLSLNNSTREYVFNMIKAKTKKINLSELRTLWKNLRKDKALMKEEYDPESGLRHMANLFNRQKIIYSHNQTINGDFWCYFHDTRMWKKCNSTQARAFIYNHIHSSLPIKVEIDYNKVEHLTNLILRETCLSNAYFEKGKGWAFKGGKYGIKMDKLFMPSGWKLDSSIKTLGKEDRIFKELPVTYEDWIATSGNPPIAYIDFLVASSEEDMDTVELLREFGGYIISDSYYIHKMLILEGVPGSGKSILAKIWQSCVTREYSAAVSIKGLTGQFGLGVLPEVKLAIMAEARQIDFKETKALVPIILKIVGQDYIDAEAKNKNTRTELLECKVVFMTNQTPVLPDDSGALAQRLLMARFDKGFRGTKDEVLGLDNFILEQGLAPIIRWHLQGLEKLSKRKEFVEPEKIQLHKQYYLQQVDPLKSFIEAYYRVDPSISKEFWVIHNDFIRFFKAYLRRIGQYTQDMDDKVRMRAAIRNIRSLFPSTDRVRVTGNDGVRRWCIQYMINKNVVDLALEFAIELSEIE